MADYFSGKDEVELTDEFIKKLVSENKWGDGDIKALTEMRDKGGKWNTKRNSIVFPVEYF